MQQAARVTLDSTQPGRSIMRIQVPQTSQQVANAGVVNGAAVRPTAAEKRQQEFNRVKDLVLFAFGGDVGTRKTKADLIAETGVGEAKMTVMLKWLVNEDGKGETWLQRHGSTKDTEYELIVGGGGYDGGVIDLNTDMTD